MKVEEEDWMTTKSCNDCKQYLVIRVDEEKCMYCAIGLPILQYSLMGTSLTDEEDQREWWNRFKSMEEQVQDQRAALKKSMIQAQYTICTEHHFPPTKKVCDYCPITEEEAVETNTPCEQHGHKKETGPVKWELPIRN